MNEAVLAWISEHVEIAGEITEPRIRPWSTVLRVPTSDGVVWFKWPREGFDYEAALLELIVPLAPELVTEVIALRPERGWVLMADAGERGRDRPVEWAPLLSRYAELQIATAPLAGELLERGVFDFRLSALDDRFDALLAVLDADLAAALSRRLPRIVSRVRELAACPLPVMLDHGDLHDANVFVRAGHARILDWGDANVAHPLFSLIVEMDRDARGAYLEPFTVLAPMAQLEAGAELVAEHRPLLRVLEELRALRYEPAWRANVNEDVAAFLESG